MDIPIATTKRRNPNKLFTLLSILACTGCVPFIALFVSVSLTNGPSAFPFAVIATAAICCYANIFIAVALTSIVESGVLVRIGTVVVMAIALSATFVVENLSYSSFRDTFYELAVEVLPTVIAFGMALLGTCAMLCELVRVRLFNGIDRHQWSIGDFLIVTLICALGIGSVKFLSSEWFHNLVRGEGIYGRSTMEPIQFVFAICIGALVGIVTYLALWLHACTRPLTSVIIYSAVPNVLLGIYVVATSFFFEAEMLILCFAGPVAWLIVQAHRRLYERLGWTLERRQRTVPLPEVA